jgi:hypothetical protein
VLTRKSNPQSSRGPSSRGPASSRGQWMSHAPSESELLVSDDGVSGDDTGDRNTGQQPVVARFSGTLNDLAVADLIQIVQLLGKSAHITVTRGGAESHLWCSDGELIDAESGSAKGEAALFRVLSFEHGWLVAELRAVERARSIFGTSQQLLLEAARRKDELVRRGEPVEPAIDSVRDTRQHEAAEIAAERIAEVAQRAASLPPIVAQGLRAEPAAAPRGFPWLALASVLLLPGAYFWGAHAAPAPELASGAQQVVAQQVVAPLAVSAPKPENYEVSISTEPQTAELWLDGKQVATGHLHTSELRDGASHELSVKAPGYAPVTIFFADAAPPAVVRLERLPAPRTAADEALSAAVRGALTIPAKGAVPASPVPAQAAPAPARPPAAHGKSSGRARNEPHVRVIGEEEPVVRVLD